MQRHEGELLTGLLIMACSACFPINPEPPAKDDSTHNGLDPPSSITLFIWIYKYFNVLYLIMSDIVFNLFNNTSLKLFNNDLYNL